jgi:hypothetical protein
VAARRSAVLEGAPACRARRTREVPDRGHHVSALSPRLAGRRRCADRDRARGGRSRDVRCPAHRIHGRLGSGAGAPGYSAERRAPGGAGDEPIQGRDHAPEAPCGVCTSRSAILRAIFSDPDEIMFRAPAPT